MPCLFIKNDTPFDESTPDFPAFWTAQRQRPDIIGWRMQNPILAPGNRKLVLIEGCTCCRKGQDFGRVIKITRFTQRSIISSGDKTNFARFDIRCKDPAFCFSFSEKSYCRTIRRKRKIEDIHKSKAATIRSIRDKQAWGFPR